MMVMFRDAKNQQEDPAKVRKDFKKDGVPVEFYLNKVLIAQEEEGFISRKNANRRTPATGDIAYSMCIDPITDQQRGGDKVNPANVSMINAMLQWIGEFFTDKKTGD